MKHGLNFILPLIDCVGSNGIYKGATVAGFYSILQPDAAVAGCLETLKYLV